MSDVVDEFFEKDSMKPFSQISDLSSYAASIVRSQPKDPRVGWNSTMDVVSIDGERIALAQLRDGIKEKMETFSSLLLDLTGESKVPNWMSDNLPPLVDQPREKAAGYTFLDDQRFTGAHLGLLKRLVEDPQWRIGQVDNSGRYIWNTNAIIRFLSYAEKMVEIIMLLFQLICGKRGAEIADAKIRNTRSCERSFVIQLECMIFIARQTKTSNMTGQDSYLPTRLPDELALLLIHYLVTVRPLERIFAHILYGEDSAALYHTYLFISKGRLLQSEDNAKLVGKFFRDSCMADIKLNRCRHLTASIGREFVDETHLTPDKRCFDMGMGHSSGVARSFYAQDEDMLEFATSDQLFNQCLVDAQYQAVLGFGKSPPPVPRRLRYGKPGTIPTEESLSAAVTEALKSTLPSLVGELAQHMSQSLAVQLQGVVQKEVREALSQLQLQLQPQPPPLATTEAETSICSSTTATEGSLVKAGVVGQRHHRHLNSTFKFQPQQGIKVAARSKEAYQSPASSSTTHFPDSNHQPEHVRQESSPLMFVQKHPATSWTSKSQDAVSCRIGSSSPVMPVDSEPSYHHFHGADPDPPSPPASFLNIPSSPQAEIAAHDSDSFESFLKEIGPNPTNIILRKTLPSTEDNDDTAAEDHWGTQDSDPFTDDHSFRVPLLPPSLPNRSLDRLAPVEKGKGKKSNTKRILEAFRAVYGPEALPKSQAQLDICEAVVAKEKNVLAILPTNAGKSAAWLIGGYVSPQFIILVVVPFKRLLEQHLAKAEQVLGEKRVMRWTSRTQHHIPEEVCVLFMATESMDSKSFHW